MKFVCASLMLLIGLLLLFIALAGLEPEGYAPSSQVTSLHREGVRHAQMDRIVRRQLNVLEEKDRESYRRLVASLNQPFEEMGQVGVPRLVADLTSYGSKWEVVKSLPHSLLDLDGPDPMAAFVSERMHKHLPQLQRLDDLLANRIDIFVYDLERNRNEMAVSLAADLEGFGLKAQEMEPFRSDDSRQPALKIREKLRQSAYVSLRSEATSLVGSEVAFHASAYLVSFLGGGVLSAPATFGVSIIVAVGADIAYSAYAEKQLTISLQNSLEKLRAEVVDSSTGICPQVGDFLDRYHLALHEQFVSVPAQLASR